MALRRFYPPGNKIFFCPTATKIEEGGEMNCTFIAWHRTGSLNGKSYKDYLPKEYLTADSALIGSYGFNRRISNVDPKQPCIPNNSAVQDILPRQFSNVRFAGGNLIPVFGDNMNDGGNFCYQADPTPFEGAPVPYWNGMETAPWLINRHGSPKEGITNLSFLDGTVRKAGLKELWVLHWHKLWKDDITNFGTPDWSTPNGWMVPFKDYK